MPRNASKLLVTVSKHLTALGPCLFLLLVEQSLGQRNMRTSIYMLFSFFLGSIALFIISRVLLPLGATNHTQSNLQRKFMLVQSAGFPEISLGICLLLPFTFPSFSYMALTNHSQQTSQPSPLSIFHCRQIPRFTFG